MHRQGLDEHPQKKFAFLTSDSESPENHRNEVYACFGACLSFKMGWMAREGQPDS